VTILGRKSPLVHNEGENVGRDQMGGFAGGGAGGGRGGHRIRYEKRQTLRSVRETKNKGERLRLSPKD